MSLSNTTVKASYPGDGIQDTFAIPFSPITDDSLETKVYIRNESDPNNITETLMVEGALNDYVLDGAPDSESFDVNVVFNAGSIPTGDEIVVIIRSIVIDQTLDLTSAATVPLKAMERTYDKLAALIQEVDEKLKRVPMVRVTEQLADSAYELPEPTGGVKQLFGWNAAGDAIELTTVSGIISGADHTLLSNIGTNTHAQIDTHIADASIHFTEASISHLNIQDIGSNTHAQIDTHIADSSLHFTVASISHTAIQDIGTNTHAQIDTHIADSTIHFTEASIDHTAILNVGTNTHAQIDAHIADSSLHFTVASIDHTAILNVGTNTHAQIDAHIADSTIHFTEASIDHTAILNVGTNTHAQIDTHIADSSLHFTVASIDHTAILNVGTNTHAQIDSHIADSSIHFTEASIDHTAIQNVGSNTHAQIDSHIASTSNPHAVTITQAIAADGGTDISVAELEILTDASNADALHSHLNEALSDSVCYLDVTGANGAYTTFAAAAADASASIIVIRPGTYSIDNSAGAVTCNKSIITQGGVIFTCTTPANSAIDFNGAVFTGGVRFDTGRAVTNTTAWLSCGSNVKFISGTYSNFDEGYHIGFFGTSAINVKIRDCEADGFGKLVTATGGQGPFNLDIQSCTVNFSQRPCYFNHTRNNGKVVFSNCKFVNSTNDTIEVGTSVDANFILTTENCLFDAGQRHILVGDPVTYNSKNDTFSNTGAGGSVNMNNAGSTFVVTGSSMDVAATGTGDFLGFYFDTDIGRFVNYADTDFRSVTVLRDGGGDYDTIDDALAYLAGSGFTPTASDFFIINVGAGTFTVDNSGGAVSLPAFIAIVGEGPSLTNIRGNTAGNPLFEGDSVTIQECSLGNCTIAVQRAAATSGTITLQRCEFTTLDTALSTDAGFNFMNLCTILSFDGPAVIFDGGTICSISNCQFVLPSTNAKFIEVNDGNVSIRNNAFDSTLITGTLGYDINDGVRVESANNVFTEVETAMNIADSATLSFSSKSDRITEETTSIVIEGAGGTNSAAYEFSDLTCSPETMTLNGNRPPQSYTDDEGDWFYNRHSNVINTTATLDHENDVVLCDSGSAFTVTLPPKALYANRHYTIKNINTGVVTIDGDGSDTIDGATTIALNNQYDFVTLYCDEAATEWYIIATNF